MLAKPFAIVVPLLSIALASAVSAMGVQTASASIALRNLIQAHSDVVAGPYCFDDFSLQVESTSGKWSAAPSAVVDAVAVRPMIAEPAGIEISSGVKATDDISNYLAFALDYRLTSSIGPVDGATVTLQAAAATGSAAVTDSLIVAPAASSGVAAHADTEWSSAIQTAGVAVTASTEFDPATVLNVSDVATIQPGNASVLAYAVDNVFVPEPAFALLPIACFKLIRMRRTVL